MYQITFESSTIDEVILNKSVDMHGISFITCCLLILSFSFIDMNNKNIKGEKFCVNANINTFPVHVVGIKQINQPHRLIAPVIVTTKTNPRPSSML